MVDASLVLSDVWLGWLEEEEDDEAVSELVVSRALVSQLQERPDRRFFPWLPEDQQHLYELNRERALGLLEGRGIELFTYDEVVLPRALSEIADSLSASNDPDAQVLLDEYGYLMSQSWMVSATHASVAAFLRGGAGVVRVTRRFTRAIAAAVVPKEHIPTRFKPGFLVKVGAKWVVLGAAGGAGTVGGAAIGTLVAGPVGTLAGGGAGGTTGGALAVALFYEFDP
jgi:hypothetical protein